MSIEHAEGSRAAPESAAASSAVKSTFVRRDSLLFCSSSRGTVLVEAAMTIPVTIVLIAILVDLWTVLRWADYVRMASRHGARAAAAESNILFRNWNMVQACSDNSSSPVLGTGVALAHAYLAAVGLESGACVPGGTPVRICSGDAFTFSSEFDSACEGGFCQRTVRVSVAADVPPHCIVCAPGLQVTSLLQAQSIFAVEVDCSSLGPVT